ncbi:flavin-containing monooxygenase [Nevskia ramosa]|uniref:flavin-containing monooxygenase n=1 Tax=Nevskia ramosa TaxID=64002 RepID=UPI0003B79D19|nr:NAD(P)/FAD-dependent oxidoreductase [Nevskia ramosa]
MSIEMMAERALAKASIPTLLACLAHLTGERRWIAAPYLPKRDISLFPDPSGGLSEPLQAEIRAAAAQLMKALQDGHRQPAAPPDDAFMREIMSVSLGEDVAAEYVPMIREEMGLADRRVHLSVPAAAAARSLDVLVIGAGISGLCAAVRLAEMGIPFRIVEKSADLGGTWLDNDYPEAGVDTPNHFYSYSFEPNVDWSGNYAKRGEVLAYLRNMAERRDLRRHIRFGIEVLALHWHQDRQQWQIDLRDAEGRVFEEWASVVISAVGQLNRPKMAAFPGMETFAGSWWHSARWPADADLAGKHVAVIGTGASGMQFLRSVAAEAAKVTVFQRSPQWARPDPDYHGKVSDETRWLLRHMPWYYAWYRFSLIWRFGDGLLRTLRHDPEWPHPERAMNHRNDRHREAMTRYLLSELEGRDDLIAKCLPDYPPYGKRILVDNGWYQALRRDNVELITEAVQCVDNGQLLTTGRRVVKPDVIILATGFEAGKMLAPMDIRGRSGVPLRERWGDDNPMAYLGTTVADYPNLFVISGPNTGLAHGGSLMFMSECQMRYIGGCLKAMIEGDMGAVEVRQAVQDDYCRRVDEEHAQLVWTHGGMRNWYRNDRGRVFSPVPWRLVDYWAMTREPNLADYMVTPKSRATAA